MAEIDVKSTGNRGGRRNVFVRVPVCPWINPTYIAMRLRAKVEWASRLFSCQMAEEREFAWTTAPFSDSRVQRVQHIPPLTPLAWDALPTRLERNARKQMPTLKIPRLRKYR